jgi:CRISPR/Cas system CSM-associated protein Csm4 (group 5 of RAMP superfamily)
MKYINYTPADEYNDWVKSVKKKKRKNKQYSSKIHKNNNSI